VLDSFECGIVLAGSEVKSIRGGRANLQDSYARVEDGELWLHGMHIAPYEFSRAELEPTRRRKLLLHRKQIDTLARATGEKGVTLVPLRVYFKDGRAKLELAVAKGKRSYDKRSARPSEPSRGCATEGQVAVDAGVDAAARARSMPARVTMPTRRSSSSNTRMDSAGPRARRMATSASRSSGCAVRITGSWTV
jgi:SsrA-binding protein